MSKKPKHGICEVCGAGIEEGVKWTLTEKMFRVHATPDDCIAVLHPELNKAFMDANPDFVSKYRYQPRRLL